MAGYVFISYSKHDREYVVRLAEHVNQAGIEVWYDTELSPGESWWTVIQGKVDGCSAVLVVMSPNAEESRWVQRETLQAERTNRPIVPLLLGGKPLSYLADVQHEDVTDGRMPGDEFLTRLRGLLDGAEPATTESAVTAEPLGLIPNSDGEYPDARHVPAAGIEFSPANDLLIATYRRDTVQATDLRSGDVRFSFVAPHVGVGDTRVTAIAWSPDGQRLAACITGRRTGGAGIFKAVIYDLRSASSSTVDLVSATGLAWAPDANAIAFVGRVIDIRSVEALEARGRLIVGPWQGDVQGFRAVAWSPDGQRLVGAGYHQYGDYVAVWHAASGAQVLALPPLASYPVAWSPDGNVIATGYGGGFSDVARLWQAQVGSAVGSLRGQGTAATVRYSPNGAYLATASSDQIVRIWSASTGGQLAELLGHTAPVSGVSWSRDGSLLASVGADGVRLWRVGYV